jgi:uncharacterized protein (TIGR03435 family)
MTAGANAQLKVLSLSIAILMLPFGGHGQSLPDAEPAFEVASVRVRSAPSRISESDYGGNHWTITSVSLVVLIAEAFGLPRERMAGAEKLGTERYDIAAKTEDGVTVSAATLAPRLRRLLRERFGLQAHRETRSLKGYALVVARGGAKLQPARGTEEDYVTWARGLTLSSVTLGNLAGALNGPAGGPVVDKTGLSGTYDFDVRFAVASDTNPSLPSLFTALQEKYGLKLEPETVQVDMLVIDKVNRTPTEN